MSDGVDMTKIFVLLLSISLTSCALFSKDPTEQRKADIYFSQGTQNLISGNYTEALNSLLKADELKKNDSDILNNLAMAYYFKDRSNIALRTLARSLKLNPKNSDARNNLATILMQNGKTEKAKAQYKKVLDDLVYKKTFRVYYNLGLISLKENKKAQAKEYFAKSVGHRDDYCAAHFQLALLHEEDTSYANALKHYEKSARNNCKDYSLPYIHMARINLKLGKEYRAKDHLLKVVNEYPHHQRNYSTAKSLLGKIDKKNRIQSRINKSSTKFKSENF